MLITTFYVTQAPDLKLKFDASVEIASVGNLKDMSLIIKVFQLFL